MISAVVLAAGQSARMGKPKMLLPWGKTTVIGKVISTLTEAGLSDVYVVTGGAQAELEKLLDTHPVHLVFNDQFMNGEMLTSVQVGLSNIEREIDAILIVLGDQPQIETLVVQAVIERYRSTAHELVVPSYRMHRGHPWLLGKSYWIEVLGLHPPFTLRDFLNEHNGDIDYVNVDTPSVVQDLDTREDYHRYKP